MPAPDPRTIPRLFEDSVQKFSQKVMMWEKKGDAYSGSTYREIQESVHAFAAGLIGLGVEKGDRLGLISEGRNDWVIAELGILFAGAINVPLSVKLEERSDLKFRLAHSGCRMVIVSGNQAHKVMKMRVDLPDLKKSSSSIRRGRWQRMKSDSANCRSVAKNTSGVIDLISKNDGSNPGK